MVGSGRIALIACSLAAVLAGCGKDARDAEQGKEAVPAPVTVQALEGVQLELHLPDSVAFGQMGDLRITVANRSGAVLTGARLQLMAQAPLRPLADSETAPSTRGAVPPDSFFRKTFVLDPVAAGQALEVPQRLGLPPATVRDTVSVPLRIRAWLESADGKPIGNPVEDTLLPRVPSAAACGGGDVHVMRYGVGGVRLGMKADQLRGLCPGVRDTAWRAEGTAEKGLVFPMAGHPLLAVLSTDSVARVVVRDRGLTTPVGVGVGSTLGDLRTRYGRTCAGPGEGGAAVWFPNAPGISFGVAPPPGWTGDPAQLPDTATVARLWVRSGADDCPAAPPPPASTPAPAPKQDAR